MSCFSGQASFSARRASVSLQLISSMPLRAAHGLCPTFNSSGGGESGVYFKRSEEASSVRRKGEIPCGERGKNVQEMNNFAAAVPPPARE